MDEAMCCLFRNCRVVELEEVSIYKPNGDWRTTSEVKLISPICKQCKYAKVTCKMYT